MKEREALKLALEALKHTHPSPLTSFYTIGDRDKAIKAIEEHLAQPERHELQAEGKHPAPCARFCEANAFQIEIRNLKAQLAQPEQERPQNCGTGYCSCIECVMEPEPMSWESILGAVARGWCYEENANKTMDSELAVAIAKEVQALCTTPPQRTWVGLNNDDLVWIYSNSDKVGQAISNTEAKLRSKNT